MKKWDVGMGISWENIKGDKFEGIITEVDNNVLFVKCTDGKTRAIET